MHAEQRGEEILEENHDGVAVDKWMMTGRTNNHSTLPKHRRIKTNEPWEWTAVFKSQQLTRTNTRDKKKGSEHYSGPRRIDVGNVQNAEKPSGGAPAVEEDGGEYKSELPYYPATGLATHRGWLGRRQQTSPPPLPGARDHLELPTRRMSE